MDKDDSIVVQGMMKGYFGISGALAACKLDLSQINELIGALSGVLNLRALRPNHRFEARLDPKNGRIRKFLYRTSNITAVEVIRTPEGALRVQKQELPLTVKVAHVSGQIESSLNKAMFKAAESSALVAMFVDLFSWDINWYVDPREGDEFRIVVEKMYHADTFQRYGRILAAEYRGNLRRFQAFYYQTPSGQANYYTTEGRSIRRAFLKTPLNFRRLSSKFNLRRHHPVLHTTKGHYGVDYAAAIGTPIWAAADGTVVSAGRSGGSGNMVVLSHAGSVVTVYMHLSRFPKHIKAGLKVKQREEIGYVGSTGLSTGPHLHYGIKIRGRYIDPLTFNVRKGEMLSRSDLLRFLDRLPDRIAVLEKIPLIRTASTAPTR